MTDERGHGAVVQLDARQRAEIERLCRDFGASRLELFGSATGPDFDAATSDLDFLVVLEPPRGLGYADAWFGLKEALERLFGRHVDLVSLASLRNPYFLDAIAASRRLLYAA